jgi:alpha-mannosidase
MNYQWGYQETVSITTETFRTMLDLMKEYPDFTYSQSQASVYEIVEKYDPAQLTEIKQRVKEGRWELAATSWVECDKNMPNGESLCRHISYTKKYLSELFDIDPDTLCLDYEPDTFGHAATVPEILQDGGVDYYYHCRGCNPRGPYRWQSPSGRKSSPTAIPAGISAVLITVPLLTILKSAQRLVMAQWINSLKSTVSATTVADLLALTLKKSRI